MILTRSTSRGVVSENSAGRHALNDRAEPLHQIFGRLLISLSVVKAVGVRAPSVAMHFDAVAAACARLCLGGGFQLSPDARAAGLIVNAEIRDATEVARQRQLGDEVQADEAQQAAGLIVRNQQLGVGVGRQLGDLLR